ncbi:aquaporin-11 [Stigmatopora nigra]
MADDRVDRVDHMNGAWVSVATIAGVVLLCELLRGVAARCFRGGAASAWGEAASTLQLCYCTHELKALGQAGSLGPAGALTLGYGVTLVHVLSFRESTCNPCGVLERAWRGTCTGSGAKSKAKAGVRNATATARNATATAILAAQCAAALAARHAFYHVRSLGLAEHHARRPDAGCPDPLGGTVTEATAVEVACAFAVQTATLHLRRVDDKLRAHVMATLITALAYAGGNISGALFNPVLAFSVNFPCAGHTYLDYCLIYWLGPASGVVGCILLFEKILPSLRGGKATIPDGDGDLARGNRRVARSAMRRLKAREPAAAATAALSPSRRKGAPESTTQRE